MSQYKVFKFGGGSVKDAEAFRQALRIIRANRNQPLAVVLSAVGKTTNALEGIARLAHQGDDFLNEWQALAHTHQDICNALFPADAAIHQHLTSIFRQIREKAIQYADTPFDFFYDQIVPLGEMISVHILQALLESEGIPSLVAGVEKLILCDPPFREGRVRWKETEEKLQALLLEDTEKIWIIPGFTGGTTDGQSITLGREGSDFSAAILAWALRAEELIIWKDVPGIMNADPEEWPGALKYDTMPYSEAMEMAFYGAKVIHPKTIKPLENKGIPLSVKAFHQPGAKGTLIGAHKPLSPPHPSVIVKKDQILFTLTPRDYAFINEQHIHRILGALCDCQLRTHLMQASALHFSFCTDEAEGLEIKIKELLSGEFIIRYNQGLQLLTLRHYQKEDWQTRFPEWEILMEQRSRTTIQALMRPPGK
jgi:aspartate kinase